MLVTGNHQPDLRDILFVPDTDERNFEDREKAIVFLLKINSSL
jgi:hypothetical protein